MYEKEQNTEQGRKMSFSQMLAKILILEKIEAYPNTCRLGFCSKLKHLSQYIVWHVIHVPQLYRLDKSSQTVLEFSD